MLCATLSNLAGNGKWMLNIANRTQYHALEIVQQLLLVGHFPVIVELRLKFSGLEGGNYSIRD